MNLWRINRYYFLRLRRLGGTPHALAGGVAIGVLIGLTPTMPLHTLLIILFAFLTRTSAVAGIIVSWLVCNPLTYLPIYYISAVIGNHLTPYTLNLETVQSILDDVMAVESMQKSLTIIMDVGYETLVVMGVGGFCLALPFAIVSYYLALPSFTRIQEKRRDKKVLS